MSFYGCSLLQSKKINRFRKEINGLLSKAIKRLVREINRLLNKEIHRTRKEINSLLSKGMSNIHLNATIKKNWRSQTFDFLHLKKSVPRSVFEELQHMQISLSFKSSCCNLKIKDLGAKMCVAFLLF